MITDKEIQKAARAHAVELHGHNSEQSDFSHKRLNFSNTVRDFTSGVNSHIAKQKWGADKIAELEERVKELETSNREKQTIIEIIRGEYP